MFKYLICVVVSFLVGLNAEKCLTPSGQNSECVSLYECDSLVSVFAHIPIPTDVIKYLRASFCGFDGTTPKVCCGALPSTVAHQTNKKPTAPSIINASDHVDPVNPDDSYPESRKKCGKDASGDRIFGGTATDLDEFPWVALLGYRSTKGYMIYVCGGALINHRYILTAAHCLTLKLQQTIGQLTSVRLGEYDIESNPDCKDDDCADPLQEILVHSYHPHTGYVYTDTNRADDIGLVRLLQRAKYNDFVKPICLVSKENSKYLPGKTVYVAGWGRTESGFGSPIKLKVVIPIYDHSNCTLKYSQNFNLTLTEKQVCAGGNVNEDSCNGDSGGPVMRLLPGDIWEAIAVVSFGYSCGRSGWPGVYTSVAHYLDWIQSIMIQTNI